MRLTAFALPLLCLLLLSACASGERHLRAGLPAPPLPAGLPSLARLAQLPPSPSQPLSRSVSAINGADPVLTGGSDIRTEGSALAILPGSDEDLAWAVYTQDGITDDKPVQLDFFVEPAAILPGSDEDLPMEFWVALSDYTKFSWSWRGPFGPGDLNNGTDLNLVINSATDFQRYVSAADGLGNCQLSYVVLVTRESQTAANGVRLNSSATQTSASYITNKPHHVPVDPLSVDASSTPHEASKQASAAFQVLVSWDHIAERSASDLRNTAQRYEILRQQDGQSAPEVIDSVDAPQHIYYDPPAGGYPSGATLPPVPGTSYTYFVKAYNPENGATPKSSTNQLLLPTDPPEAVFSAPHGMVNGTDPLARPIFDGPAPLSLTLNPLNSNAAAGRNLVSADWDFDGDGVYAEAGDEANWSGLPLRLVNPAVVFGVGTRNIALRVIDDQGESDLRVQRVGAYQLDTAVIDQSSFEYSEPTVIKMQDGSPAMAWHSPGGSDLLFSYFNGSDPTSSTDWIAPMVLSSIGGHSAAPSMALVNGRVCIAYYDSNGLVFCRANVVQPSDGLQWSIVTFTGLGGNSSPCVAAVGTRPALAYHSVGGGTGFYYRIANTTGDNAGDWPPPIQIETGNDASDNTPLAMVCGTPALAYWWRANPGDDPELHFAHASTATGSAPADWVGRIVTVQGATAQVGGGALALAEVDFQPALAWVSDGTGELRYSRATTFEGINPADWNPIVLDQSLGASLSLALVNNRPAILHQTQDRVVTLVQSSTAHGTALRDWTSRNVSAGAAGGVPLWFPSRQGLLDMSGLPGIVCGEDIGASADISFSIMQN